MGNGGRRDLIKGCFAWASRVFIVGQVAGATRGIASLSAESSGSGSIGSSSGGQSPTQCFLDELCDCGEPCPSEAVLADGALRAMGLDPQIFLSFWRGVVPFPESELRRVAFLSSLFCLLKRVDEPMVSALRDLCRLMSSRSGRYVITGAWLAGTDWTSQQAEQIVRQMGESVWPWRRRVRQGLVIVVGLAHYGHPELVKDTGFSGVPDHVRHIWD